MATQPVSSANQTVTLPPGDTTMSFTTADIKGMALGDKGSLIITFTDGHQLTVANFQDLAKGAAHITLQDGSAIDTKHLYETLAADLPAININEPAAGQSVAYNLLPGQKYTIGFDLHQPGVHATEKAGALVITFGDHGQVILQNVTSAVHVASADQPHVTYDGKDILLADFLKDVQLAGILDLHHNAANNNDLAQAAQALAGVEPAAGAAGVGAIGGSAGFGSSILPAGFDGETPIGPIGRTDLAYGIPTLNLAVYPGLEGDGPSLSINGNPPIGPGQIGVGEPDAVVKENGSITVPITASLGDHSAAGDHLIVVVSGLPGASVGTIGQTGGVYDVAAGTITYTLPAGTDLSTDLTFTPKTFSDVDFGQLTVTVTQVETNGSTQTASGTLYVTTDAVAEAPGLTTQHATEEAGHTTAVTITTTEIDPDGSEHVTGIKISGLPAGATLNHGTLNSDGSYTLTQDQLAGLTVTTTKAVAPGDYTLTVTATSTETNLSGKEADFSDNSATTTLPLTLTVTPNSIPVITSTGLTPNGDQIMEANLNPATPGSDTVSDHVTVNYGVDGPGAGVTLNGQHTASVASLTSGGAAVTISENGNSYVGTANGHTVFELTVNADGTYKFTLDAPLDHPLAGNDGITLGFGITATDSDGDTASGTIKIDVIDDVPVAHADVNDFFASAGHTSGNVISGVGDVDVATGKDYLSQDGNNHITSIAYGTTTDTIAQGGSVTIDGKYGELVIHSDGSYTYTLFQTTMTTSEHFTGGPFGTVMEGVAVDPATTTFGEIHSNLAVTAGQVVTGALDASVSGNNNSLGAFTIDANGDISAVKLIEGNTTGKAGEAFSYTAGATGELGFFLVQNGSNANNAYAGVDLTHGSLSLVADYGQADQHAANIHDSGANVSLVYTDASGHATVLNGNLFFTSDAGTGAGLNSDGVIHTVSGTDASGTTERIGFEDATGGGDKDYNDTVFDIHLTQSTTTTATGSDTFTYGLTDNDGDTSTATLTFNGEGAPTISVNGGPPATTGQVGVTEPDAVVKENGHVDVPVVATLGAGAPAGDHLTVVISGIPAGVGAVSAADGGVYDAAHGTVTWTLAAGQNLNSTLTFTPTAYSDVDFGSLTATVTQSDPASGTSQTASAGFYVTTDAVAEAPGLTTGNESEEAGKSASFAIATKEIDPDGSEHVTSIQISGLPAGATLNHGTLNSDGSYTLTQDQLTGLTINTTKATAQGEYTLTVVATSTETNLSGKEADYSDNSATTTTHPVLTVTSNSIPVITSTGLTPNGDQILEANLNPAKPGVDTVSDHVTVNYGVDGPGAGVTLNGQHSASIANLTSGGAAVTIAEVGSSYVGTANGHEVFTLAVNSDGTYKFTLDGPLDHPLQGSDNIALNFGITATDSDGDTANGTITINVVDDVPVAHSDVNDFYTSLGHTSGNVISGAGDVDVTTGKDYQSQDGNNHITSVAYGTTTDAIAQGGSATIDGKYGELVIHSDGTYTYTLGAGDTAGTSTVTSNMIYTGNAFPTDLKEGVAISGPDMADLGVVHANLAVNGTTTVSGTITHDGAGYDNVLGAFTIGSDGTLQAAQILDPSITGTGDKFTYTATGTNAEIGYFVIANGANLNMGSAGIDPSKGTLNFIADYGQADQHVATSHDMGSNISLVYTDATGHQTVAQGDIYFTTDRGDTATQLNNDNTVHVVSGLTNAGDGSALSIGFEDLPNGGDKDYNDVIFSTTSTTTTTTAGSDQFTYTLTDGDGDNSQATLTFNGETPPGVTITVNGGSPITSDTGTQVADAVVKENGHITIPVTATLNNASSAGEALTVVISGIPSGVGTVTAANGGVYDAAHGTVTWTLAPGASLNSSITLTPTAYSDVDFGNLHVSASATDAASGTVSSSANIYVTTDAVAEAPGLTVQNTSEEAGHTTALHITTTEIDPDGSEGISSITVAGLPSGATLSAGTHNSDGSYTLTQDQLNGLTVTTTKGTSAGDYTLTVVSTSTEMHLSGKEVDTSDNSASTTQSLTLHVDANAVPIIVTPAAQTVYEHDLNPTTMVSGAITVNYNGDTGAGVTASGVFSADVPIVGGAAQPGPGGITGTHTPPIALSGGPLTSDGETVTVTQDGNVYTGTAHGDTIFTMTIGADGHYNFVLDGTLDHPQAGNDGITLNFGVTATDTDGDSASTTISINVIDDVPMAHDDVNATFDSAGHATGNVISGFGDVNVLAGIDTQSHDAPNHVTAIEYNGNVQSVAQGGDTLIDGKFGQLDIHSDGTYTYTLGADGTAGHAATTAPVTYTGNAFPTDLQEGVAISAPDQADLGVVHANLAVNGTTTVSGVITHDGAGYDNILGAYTIGSDGTFQAVQILDPSITDTGDKFTYTATGTNAEIGYFVIADGASLNIGSSGIDPTKGTLSFIADYGHADQHVATAADAGSAISLVYTDGSGHQTVAQGDIYFTTDRGTGSQLNNDNTVHVVSGLTNAGDGSALSIGFEDLPNGGDKDYNDVIFSTTATTTTPATGSDHFTYTLTDGDGDNSQANLTFSGTAPATAIIVDGGAHCEFINQGGSITLPIHVTASGDGAQVTTLYVSGVASDLAVGSGWTAVAGQTGVYEMTLAAGTTSYDAALTLTSTGATGVDESNLMFTAVTTDGGMTATSTANLNIGILDTPVLNVPTSLTWENYAWSQWSEPLAISASVSGAHEIISSITVNLNDTFDGMNPAHYSLADIGATLNEGTQVSSGIWQISINAQDATQQLANLSIIVPGLDTNNPNQFALHSSATPDWHNDIIQVTETVVQTLSCGCSDTITVTKAIGVDFGLTPLVVDLTGHGFNLTDNAHGVLFDMNADGKLDQTSWIGAGTGLLAIDLNHNGVIDNTTELFGNGSTSGFTILGQYDANHDGIINAKDAVFNDLVVWQDANHDGISQPGELTHLSDLGIVSISLATITANETIGDSIIGQEATATWADGHTTQVGDAWFNVTDSSLIGVGVRMDGTSANDYLTGTAHNDVLAGHGGNDVLTGGAGADTFMFDAISGAAGHGVATITDFNTGEGDKLDLSSLLTKYDPVQSSIDNFVHATSAGGNTTISVDVTGSGNAANFVNVAVLQGVSHVNVDDLLATHHLVAQAAAAA